MTVDVNKFIYFKKSSLFFEWKFIKYGETLSHEHAPRCDECGVNIQDAEAVVKLVITVKIDLNYVQSHDST